MSNAYDQVKLAKVAVSKLVYDVDFLYSYLVPKELFDLKVGQIVLVPFGKSLRDRLGVVYDLETVCCCNVYDLNLKPVKEILNKDFVIKKDNLNLSKFMKERYFCTFFDALKTIIPIKYLIERVNCVYRLSENYKEKLNNIDFNSKALVDFLKSKKNGATINILKKHFKKDVYRCIDYLLKENIILKDKKTEKLVNFSNKIVKLSDAPNYDRALSKKQKEVVDLLKVRREMSVKEIIYSTGVSRVVISNLLKNEIIEYFEVNNATFNNTNYNEPINGANLNENPIVLNKEQEIAFKSICDLYKSGKFCVHLLFGVTGSGKTSVYMKLIDIAFLKRQGVIVLLPEIALTSQVINKFYERYGDKVSVYHSALTSKERLEQFKKVSDGTCSIVVGTRSAVFLPVKNLGLIIIDEEQEDSYKSESPPRYNTIDIAKYKCYFSNCLLLISSATPNVCTFYSAKTGKYSLSKLATRYKGADLPDVKIVDIGKELQNGNTSLLSSYLINELRDTLNNNKKAIFLINRRGYSTFLICRNCEKVLMCPRCSVSLVYHSANSRLICHYCGYSVKDVHVCPYCKSREIKYAGMGTQKVEEDLKKLIPEAKILRMDSDINFTKNEYEKRLENFKEQDYNVMLGTQMVAKGLDFKDVTLVAILCADQSLYSNDYRGYERSFSLFTQVIGRSGRDIKNKGKAIIQTFTPQNPIIKLSAKQDYEKFFETEIKLRKLLRCPPFVNICLIVFKGKFENKVKSTSENFYLFIKTLISEKYKYLPLCILRPSCANVLKVNNNYRYKIVIKYKNQKLFRSFLKEAFLHFGEKFKTNNVSIFADINPTVII